jgi:TfoX/Sxy family transcriptional regulator of competence genes
MAYDDQLAVRVRDLLATRPGYSERKMFGGLCFMLNGHMCCGIVGDELMVRLAPDKYEDALARPHARPMDFTGRPMRGMVYVGTGGIEGDGALAEWVERGAGFAASLPPKKR